MFDALINFVLLIFDIKILKRKRKVSWLDIIVPPSVRIAVMVGITIGFIAIGFSLIFKHFFKRNTTIKIAEQIMVELNGYKTFNSGYPKSLDVILEKPVYKDLEHDGWGNSFLYTSSDGSFILTSMVRMGY